MIKSILFFIFGSVVTLSFLLSGSALNSIGVFIANIFSGSLMLALFLGLLWAYVSAAKSIFRVAGKVLTKIGE